MINMMHLPVFLRTTAACLLAGAVALPAPAAGHPSVKRPFNLAPSANLDYQVKARQSGLKLSGSSMLKWRAADSKYQINVETHAMLVGKILTATSTGAIDAYGLAPLSSVEQRLRKSPTTAHFNRQAKTITFTASDASYPLSGGEQDRNSILWQLVANARAAPKKFVAGSAWQYFVAGQRNADSWTFKVGKSEKIATPMGPVNAVRVVRLLPPNSQDQQLDIWLAPSLEWYPVKLRFTEPDGNYIEQTLARIEKK